MNEELIKLDDIRVIPSKEEVLHAASELNERYCNGGVSVNPLKEYSALKALEEFVGLALPVVQPWAIQAAEQLSDAERKNMYGAQIVLGEKRVYLYDSKDLDELEEQLADAKKVVADINARIKKLKADMVNKQQAVYDAELSSKTITLKRF